jgi:2'-5' RNA ligase
LKFVRAEQAHYTLRFLGEQPPERRDAAVRAAIVAARAAKPFELELEKLGVFADERHAHTLWIGAGTGRAELFALASLLEGALSHEQFAPESRPFVAHMTVARVKRKLAPATVRSLLSTPAEALGKLAVGEFVLFQSRPGKDGALYVPLETFQLRG